MNIIKNENFYKDIMSGEIMYPVIIMDFNKPRVFSGVNKRLARRLRELRIRVATPAARECVFYPLWQGGLPGVNVHTTIYAIYSRTVWDDAIPMRDREDDMMALIRRAHSSGTVTMMLPKQFKKNNNILGRTNALNGSTTAQLYI
tara:strand:+ start:970 stop:1404 length:435 start_codon:yes stop_codon:yes gene_type:complete